MQIVEGSILFIRSFQDFILRIEKAGKSPLQTVDKIARAPHLPPLRDLSTSDRFLTLSRGKSSHLEFIFYFLSGFAGFSF